MNTIADLLNTNGPENIQERTSGSFVMGTVTANNDDDHKGLVKVSFTGWNKDKNIYEWIPVLTSYAGKEHGIYIQPEIGDIVIVGFVGPGMKTPFVMGSLFNSQSTMLTQSAEKTNVNRNFKTKGGISVSFSDEADKQSVTILTPKSLSIVMEDEKETIAIQDKAGSNKVFIDCKNGEMSFVAKSKISLTAGSSSLTLDGGTTTLKGDKCEVSGSQTATISGSQTTKVSGGSLTLEGTQTAKLSSSGPAQIAGALVQIN